MEAVACGQLKAVELLLEKGADPALRDDGRQRAIDHAVVLGHAGIARLLLHRKDPFSNDESALLVSLIHSGDEDLLRDFLLAGASIPPPARRVDDDDPFRYRKPQPGAPLAAAAVRPDPRMLRILLEFPAATGGDNPGYLVAALHQAAATGRLDNVKYLVEERKIDPDVLLTDDFGGVTVMGIGDPANKGPKPVEAYSALSRALEEGFPNIVPGWPHVADPEPSGGECDVGRHRKIINAGGGTDG